jgi:chorismate mutase-like protein
MRPLAAGLARSVGAALLALALAGQTGCATPGEPPPPTAAEAAALDRLLDLMRQRLALMREVAAWKRAAGRPIADPARERELLDRVGAQGAARGLEPGFVRAFFEAQIAAGKQVQATWFERWAAADPAPAAAGQDLAAVRAEIDALNNRLIETLAALAPDLARPGVRHALAARAERRLAGDGLDEAARALALAPLREPAGAAARHSRAP